VTNTDARRQTNTQRQRQTDRQTDRDNVSGGHNSLWTLSSNGDVVSASVSSLSPFRRDVLPTPTTHLYHSDTHLYPDVASNAGETDVSKVY